MTGLIAATRLLHGEPPVSVLAMFAAQCARGPQRVAVACGQRTLTYAELDARGTALAQALVAHGVRAGECVGLSLPRSELMLVALLGVLKAGAVYVPLDPAFPAERLRYMAEHSRLRVVVGATRSAMPLVVAAGREVVELAHLPEASTDAVALPSVHGDDAAYVLYTSGSTGVPKGVCVRHRNLANLLASMQVEPGFAVDDVLCAITTLSFDIAGLELYLPLVAGGRVVIATDAEYHDPEALLKLVAAQGVSVLQTTPTLARMLVDQDAARTLRGVRLLIGGEEMPRDLAQRLPGQVREVWNMYGPTETTVWSTLMRVTDAGAGAVPLGHPVANTVIHVLDEQQQPVAEGSIGEIWIGGAGVAKGYLYQDALTAERFISDVITDDGSRMYRTGDLGSVRDGLLHFHGRADQQIKLRGYRIELGEVEAAALAVAGVREAVASVCSVGPDDQRLVLYVVAQAADPGLADRVRTNLRARLPGYMLPQHMEWLTALPQTPNGKMDRKSLPMPAAVAAVAAAQARAAADPRQAKLAAIWCELIGVSDVQASDNFFDLGGHSLLAAELVTRVQRETGARLKLIDLATGTLVTLAMELPMETPSVGGWKHRLQRWLGRGR